MSAPASAVPAAVVPAHVPPDRVVHFDFRRGPDFLADPWGVLAAMTAKPDIVFSPELGGYWVPTKAEIIDEVFRRHDLFSSRQISIPRVERRAKSIPAGLDPPEHGKYRKTVTQMFGGKTVMGLEADMRETARRLADAFVKNGECEFVAEFARRMPVDVFLKLYGLPESLREEFVSWVVGFFQGANAEEMMAAHNKTVAYMSQWLDEKMKNRAGLEGHVLPALAAAEVDGRPLDKEEMLSMAVTLVNAGLDTVTSGMTHMMHFLATSPAHRQQLLDDPALIPNAIEEMLRRFGVASLARVVDHDVEFHGVQMKTGDMILASTPLAGLDPALFDNPLKVDFARENKRRHTAFGAGPHVCPGAMLSRVEFRIMLEELLPRLRNLGLAPGAPLDYTSGITLALKKLHLKWDVA